MICPYCKETILEGAVKCRHCGSMLHAGPCGDAGTSMSDDEVRAFVGNNSDYYLRNFARFTATGADNFAPTWNWSACGFTFIWMLYRKMYLASGITFVIFCLPGVNLMLHLAVGVLANWLYFRHARRLTAQARQRLAPQDLFATLHRKGGVHGWAITVGIAVGAVLVVLFAFFFATISTFLVGMIP